VNIGKIIYRVREQLILKGDNNFKTVLIPGSIFMDILEILFTGVNYIYTKI